MKPFRALPALAYTVALLAVPASSALAANPQIVSRLDGASGTPFPAEFGPVAGDGRYVVLRPKTAAQAAQLGVAQPADPSKLYLRDRTAGTTSEIALRATAGGPAAQGDILDLSNDAGRVLFGTGDPAITDALGLPRVPTGRQGYLVVADRAGGNLWSPKDAVGKPAVESFSLLSGDGHAALILGGAPGDPQYAADSIQRAHDNGPTEVLVNSPEGYPHFQGATDDLSVVLYQRSLNAVKRPVDAEHDYAGARAIGLATPQGNRIIAQGESVEKIVNPGGQCSYANVRLYSQNPRPLALSADGQRVSYAVEKSSLSQSPGDEGSIDGYSSIVLAPGGVKKVTSTTTSELASQVWPWTLAGTHDLFLESSIKPMNWVTPELDDFGTGYAIKSASTSFNQVGGGLQNLPVTFADGDRTVLWSSRTQDPWEGLVPPTSLPYVYAEAVTGTLPDSGSGTSLWSAGIPDTPDLAAKVTWADCTDDGGPAPVAPADLYATITLRSPVIASASAGKVKVDLQPAGYRRASKVTLEYKLFGLSYWRKTVNAGDEYVLPKPPLWLPVTLTATIFPVAGAEGEATPKPLVASRSIFATRSDSSFGASSAVGESDSGSSSARIR